MITPSYVRVTDEVRPRREYSIVESTFDPDVHARLDKPAAHHDGTPIPPKYTPAALVAESDGEGYQGMGVKALKAEVDRRNAERGEDDQISKAGKKSDLIERLDDDDNARLVDAETVDVDTDADGQGEDPDA